MFHMTEAEPLPDPTAAEPPPHLRGKSDLKLVGYVWWCGDEECDCTEPIIAWQYTERASNGMRVYRKEAIWTGTFISRGFGLDPDDPDPDQELAAALARIYRFVT